MKGKVIKKRRSSICSALIVATYDGMFAGVFGAAIFSLYLSAIPALVPLVGRIFLGTGIIIFFVVAFFSFRRSIRLGPDAGGFILS